MFRLFLLAMVAVVQLMLAPAQALAAPVSPVAARCAQVLQGSWDIDGVYGPYTELAVRQYQLANGLWVDGIAGPQTLRCLGWKDTSHLLKCGMRGATVLRLQRSLERADFWALGVAQRLDRQPVAAAPRPPRVAAKPRPAVSPAPRATARPTPRPSATPMAARPSPTPVAARPTPAPTVTPVPTPTPDQVRVPLPAEDFVTRAEAYPALVEAAGGFWFNTLPLTTGTDVAFAPTQPSWYGSAALWRGDWGIGADVVRYNPTGGAVPAMRFYQPNTLLWDAGLKYRFNQGQQVLGVGYRRLTQNNLDFFTLGLSARSPLAGEWLWLNARGLAGGNVNGGYTYDVHTGLGLQLRPLELGVGYRLMTISRLSAAEPVYTTAGPTVGLTLAF